MAGDGTEGMRSFERLRPDLVVLDVMMPGINGLEVCRRMRQSSQVPVVLLTALGEEEDRIAGLRLGADDYVTKPFSPRELALRVVSVLRRARMPRQEPVVSELADGDLRLHLGARQATLEGIELPLTAREFDLVFYHFHASKLTNQRNVRLTNPSYPLGDDVVELVYRPYVRHLLDIGERVRALGMDFDPHGMLAEPTLGLGRCVAHMRPRQPEADRLRATGTPDGRPCRQTGHRPASRSR